MIIYQDKVQLLEVSIDGYNDKSVIVNETVHALFHQGTSYVNGQTADQFAADAHVYLDPKNPTVLDNAFRLEGWYIVANPFGGDESKSWYRIESVVVGQRKLLNNQVDNVHCFLKKVSAIEDLPGES